MTFANGSLLFGAAMLAGVINAVAGGGSFLTFPALVFAHVPSIEANATSTVAMWPGSVASIGAYWQAMAAHRRMVGVLSGVSLLGGWLGAEILLRTPGATFDRLVPWLLLAATLLFAFGAKIRRVLGWNLIGSGGKNGEEPAWGPLLKAAALQLVIAIYGGFYGAGAGILMLAVLDLLGLENIHTANALKVVLTVSFNGFAVLIFILAGKIYWPEAILMTFASILGGYGGAYYAQKLPATWVRNFVIAVGVSMTVYFFLRQAR